MRVWHRPGAAVCGASRLRAEPGASGLHSDAKERWATGSLSETARRVIVKPS